jgi:hypothetical protein
VAIVKTMMLVQHVPIVKVNAYRFSSRGQRALLFESPDLTAGIFEVSPFTTAELLVMAAKIINNREKRRTPFLCNLILQLVDLTCLLVSARVYLTSSRPKYVGFCLRVFNTSM